MGTTQLYVCGNFVDRIGVVTCEIKILSDPLNLAWLNLYWVKQLRSFEAFFAVCIISNAVFLGVEVEYYVRNPGQLPQLSDSVFLQEALFYAY